MTTISSKAIAMARGADTSKPQTDEADETFDRLVARLGGEVFSRVASDYGIITTYRWSNTEVANRDAEMVRAIALDSATRSAGVIGGHGPGRIILVVSSSLTPA